MDPLSSDVKHVIHGSGVHALFSAHPIDVQGVQVEA